MGWWLLNARAVAQVRASYMIDMWSADLCQPTAIPCAPADALGNPWLCGCSCGDLILGAGLGTLSASALLVTLALTLFSYLGALFFGLVYGPDGAESTCVALCGGNSELPCCLIGLPFERVLGCLVDEDFNRLQIQPWGISHAPLGDAAGGVAQPAEMVCHDPHHLHAIVAIGELQAAIAMCKQPGQLGHSDCGKCDRDVGMFGFACISAGDLTLARLDELGRWSNVDGLDHTVRVWAGSGCSNAPSCAALFSFVT